MNPIVEQILAEKIKASGVNMGLKDAGINASIFSEMLKTNRLAVGYGLRIITQADPIKLDMASKGELLATLQTNISGQDAKAATPAVAVALAATAPVVAGIAFGARLSFVDSRDLGDFRLFTVTFAWNDGIAARTQAFVVEPDRDAEVRALWLLLGYLSQGNTVFANSNAAGITATVAADTIRANSVLQLENLVERDLKILGKS